jgi:4-hydroxy-3-methylbut-2-enyl diphosphate reductase
VPEVLVEQVVDWLGGQGFDQVEVVHSAEEHLLFALPPELRRELRAADTKQ